MKGSIGNKAKPKNSSLSDNLLFAAIRQLY